MENIIKLWVSKESAIKYTEGKLFRDLRLWECDLINSKICNKKNNISLYLSVFKFRNWYLSIASDNKSILKNSFVCYG